MSKKPKPYSTVDQCSKALTALVLSVMFATVAAGIWFAFDDQLAATANNPAMGEWSWWQAFSAGVFVYMVLLPGSRFLERSTGHRTTEDTP